MSKKLKTLAAAGLMALASIGLASPAAASNNVIIRVDPLGWNWEGDIVVAEIECDYDILSNGNKKCFQTKPGNEIARQSFSVQASKGPQDVFSREWETSTEFFVFVDNGKLTSGNVTRTPEAYGMSIINQMMGYMSYEFNRPLSIGDVPVRFGLTKSDGFYELKFFPAENAPPRNQAALLNLHETQSEGVAECDVARTLSAGDTLTTGGGDDVVCVTVDGNEDADAPITVDTGGGDDTVLIEGDTDAPVVVDTGAGDDVVIADTESSVVVTTGDGNDAVVDGGNTEVADETNGDGTVEVN